MVALYRLFQLASSSPHHRITNLIVFLPKLYRMASSSLTPVTPQECMSVQACEESPQDVNIVLEGKAQVLQPKSVFYNPVQEFNRDLTVAVISEFSRQYYHEPLHQKQVRAVHLRLQKDTTTASADTAPEDIKDDSTNPPNTVSNQLPVENGFTEEPVTLEAGKMCKNGIRILEGLSASGLRSVRFGLEVPGVREIIANDFDRNAVMYIQKNIEKNKLEDLVTANYGDVSMVMYSNRDYEDRFDVIDLDPYGSPARFLDGAVQSVSDGGLLCITCTDTAILCGNAPETCFSKYRGMSLRANFCHEMGLRIILQAIETHANAYSRYIQPLVSISADFYMRVFVRVFKGQSKVKESVTKLALVYHCVGCGSFSLQPLGEKVPTKGNNFKYVPATGPPVGQVCDHCGSRLNVGGPIWADSLHDKDFLHKVISSLESEDLKLNTKDRLLGMLSMAYEELPDVPLYYIGDGICDRLHCVAPSLLQLRSAILNGGYRVSLSHCAKNSHKTDAPAEFIWDVMRAWIKDHPLKESRLQEGSVVKAIIAREPKHNISFEIHPDANPPSRKQGMLRWQINPEPCWGPRPRARAVQTKESSPESKKEKNKKRKREKNDRDLKMYPCKQFKAGHCEHGDSCVYSHNLEAFADGKKQSDCEPASADTEKES